MSTATDHPRGPATDLLKEHPDAEVQTDKPIGKIVPCRECEKPLLVNSFYAPALARCTPCRGETGTGKGTVAVPQAGRTEPEQATNLADCLINRTEFEFMTCPFGCGDMELKHINHNDNYGPSRLIKYDGGQPVYQQTAKGETTLHQCNECKCTISMSTTAQAVFRRVNEPRTGKHVNGWKDTLGDRNEKGKE